MENLINSITSVLDGEDFYETFGADPILGEDGEPIPYQPWYEVGPFSIYNSGPGRLLTGDFMDTGVSLGAIVLVGGLLIVAFLLLK